MLPCKGGGDSSGDNENGKEEDRRRKLLSFAEDVIWRRVLASAKKEEYCSKYVSTSLIIYLIYVE